MKRLQRYAQTRVRRLKAALEKYHQFQELDSLHRIRVELKKLRAVIRVISLANPKVDYHDLFLPMRPVFRKAGRIRHPAVIAELKQKYGLEDVHPEQADDFPSVQEKFRADVPYYLSGLRKLEKRLPKLLRNISRRDIARYVNKRKKLIRRIFVPKIIHEKLHLARKHMKQVYYLTGIARVMDKKDRKAYSRLEQVMGSLHDKELLADAMTGVASTAQLTMLKKACAADRRTISSIAKRLYR